MTKDSQRALLWTKQLFYNKSNKADSLLAHKLCQKTQAKNIDKIKSPRGTTYTTPDRIASVFAAYFTELYNHRSETRQNPNHPIDPQAIESYLGDIPLPALSEEMRAQLTTPITTDEIALTIKSIKPHKCPGPDGFTDQYYKSFSDALLPHHASLYNSLLQGDALPEDML
ncbi:endonuclease, partial, partial [Pelobates cultripes]